MNGDIFQSETCMQKKTEVVIDSQQSIRPVVAFINTEIDMNLKQSTNEKITIGDLWNLLTT